MKKSVRDFQRFLDKIILARTLTGDDSIISRHYFSCANLQVNKLEDFIIIKNFIELFSNPKYVFKFDSKIEEELDKIIKENQNKEGKQNV